MAGSYGSEPATRGGSAPRQKTVKPRRKRIINYPQYHRRGLRRWLPSWKLVFGSIITLGLVLVGGFAAAVAFTDVPPPNEISRAERTIVYWNDGKTEMGQLGEANRISVPLSDVSSRTRDAVLAAEDREYYEHGGFDPRALVRAAWNDLNGGATQGASTITQQYAKNAFLSHEQTLTRKARELVLSVKLETEASKDQILENYLNTIYFGRNAYGIETAAQAYFGVPAKELTLKQSAAIAAIIRAPGGYDPETHKAKLKDRYLYVLSGMQVKGWITAEQKAKAAKKLPAFIKYQPNKSSLRGTTGYLLESVRREMLRKGYTEEDLTLGGYRITTTYDKLDQQAAVEAVTNYGPGDEKGLRIGLTSVRADTGEVVSMYGGKNYLDSQLSNADQAMALAGSTFKPFALAAAIEDGIKLNSMWDGSSPREIKGYKLQNEGNESFGQINLLRAIEKSVNTVFVDLAVQIGPDKVKNSAIRAGVPKDTVGLVADPTTVLGTASPTTLDMAGAYATFANRGQRVAPTTIKEISLNGNVQYKLNPVKQREFEDNVADTVNYALQRVVTSGTGFEASNLGRPAAGKTGTTDNNRSAWFVGYTPQMATAVMMVKQDSAGNPISLYGTGGGGSVHGGSYPARIWTAYMQTATANDPYEQFTTPSDLGYGLNDSYRYNGGYGNGSASPSPSSSASASNGNTPGNGSGNSGGSSPAPSGGSNGGSSSSKAPNAVVTKPKTPTAGP